MVNPDRTSNVNDIVGNDEEHVLYVFYTASTLHCHKKNGGRLMFKCGKTRKLKSRLFSYHLVEPQGVYLVAVMRVQNYSKAEATIFKHLQSTNGVSRMNLTNPYQTRNKAQGEWFQASYDNMLKGIKSFYKKYYEEFFEDVHFSKMKDTSLVVFKFDDTPYTCDKI
jgi:hypothetical protein